MDINGMTFEEAREYMAGAAFAEAYANKYGTPAAVRATKILQATERIAKLNGMVDALLKRVQERTCA